MSTIKELDTVVLTRDLTDHGLRKGDIGTVVLVQGNGKGYEVEFMTLEGRTITVMTLLRENVRPTGSKEIAHARDLDPVS